MVEEGANVPFTIREKMGERCERVVSGIKRELFVAALLPCPAEITITLKRSKEAAACDVFTFKVYLIAILLPSILEVYTTWTQAQKKKSLAPETILTSDEGS